MSQSPPSPAASSTPASSWDLFHISQRLRQRPTLADVANNLLHALIPDAARTAVDQAPFYLAQPSGQQAAPWRFTPLADLLIQRYLLNQAIEQPAGSVVTQIASGTEPGTPLISQSDMSEILEIGGPRLLGVFASQLLDFWNAKDGQALNLLQRISTLVANDVLAEARKLPGGQQQWLQLHTSIVFFKSSLPDGSCLGIAIRHTDRSASAVLYTLNSGLVAYASANALEAHLSDPLSEPNPGFRPGQNLFEAFATGLLEQQLQGLAAIVPGDFKTAIALAQHVDALIELNELFYRLHAPSTSASGQSSYPLPAWIHQASAADRQMVARQLGTLATLEQSNQAIALPSLARYTADVLDAQMTHDHPGQALPLATDFIVQVVDYTPPFFDPFHLTGGSSSHPEKPRALIQIAALNTQALPLERSQISLHSGKAVPTWATTAYFRQLISRVDVGKTYPAFLQHTLLDDAPQATLQQTLFIERLRILLPILLITPGPQGKGTLTEAARHCVLAAFAAGTDSPNGSVQFSQLTLQLSHSANQAVDAQGMFMIEPVSPTPDLLVLYAPHCTPQLMEFSSRAALLARLKQPGPLHDAVLDALPEGPVRTALRRGENWSPALDSNYLGGEFGSSRKTLQLTQAPVTSHALALVYRANAQSLIEQARQTTTSDAEQNWISAEKSIALVLSVLLPMFEGPLADIAWIAQFYASVYALHTAALTHDPQAEKSALVEVLIQASLLLMHGSVRTAREGTSTVRPARELGNEIHKQRSLLHLPQYPTHTLLDFSGWSSPTLSRKNLEQLRALALAPIDPLDAALKDADQQGLFSYQGRTVARLPHGWFEVEQSTDQSWRIVDPHSSTPGPFIVQGSTGHWQLDLRLRLRGGETVSNAALKRLKTQMHQAHLLLTHEGDEIAAAKRFRGLPIEVEEQLDAKAQARLACASKLESLMANSPDQLTSQTIRQLRSSAQRLQRTGRGLRIERLKALPPTATGIDFLNDQHEIVITRLGERTDVSGGKGTDFLLEFSVQDRQGKPLAYAHFHYGSASSAERDYQAAHIKKPEQRFMGLSAQRDQANRGMPVTAIYRDRISPQLARKLFLRS
ncbi:hypothetical protein EXN22_11475 [Pseudomonas tructae]|uniref:Dermonecrotic toxin N-terminal domain-containing protein n=1 Tax=Pseudomonas tructae TaxID=2518644 RepID=A0A411MHK6_9PSED|nr:hypothetical protein [Pseudomonas tructae]QBF26281.1 hypothetical protein EXN22_11475 [Pseudomonas tructae]